MRKICVTITPRVTTTVVLRTGVTGAKGEKGDMGAVTSSAITSALGYTPDNPSSPRTPTAHKATHAKGGTDALTPSDIGATSSAIGFYDAFDDSTRYAPGATITNNVSTPQISLTGDPWWISYSNNSAPTVQGGGLQSVSAPSLWYAGSSIPSQEGKMTLGFIFQQDPNPTSTTPFNNIMNISFSSSPMMGTTSPGIDPTGVIHINFSRAGVQTIDYYGGASIQCVSTAYDGIVYPWGPSKPFIAAGVAYAIVLRVDGNYLYITVPGLGSLTFYDANLSSKVGSSKTYFWWEDGRSDSYALMGKLRRVWGGVSPTPLDGDPAFGAFVGGNTPMLNGTGPYQLPGTIQSFDAPKLQPTKIKSQLLLPDVSFGLVLGGNGVDGSSRATGGNGYLEGLICANLDLASLYNGVFGYSVFEIDSRIYSPTSTATTGSVVELINIDRLRNVQSGDRQIIEIIGNLAAGTKTMAVKVFATGETALTYTGTGTGTFRIMLNRKTTSTNTDQVYAELWIGTTLVSTNRVAFNNGNYFPYQFQVTQSAANIVTVDDVRNTVMKVKMR